MRTGCFDSTGWADCSRGTGWMRIAYEFAVTVQLYTSAADISDHLLAFRKMTWRNSWPTGCFQGAITACNSQPEFEIGWKTGCVLLARTGFRVYDTIVFALCGWHITNCRLG